MALIEVHNRKEPESRVLEISGKRTKKKWKTFSTVVAEAWAVAECQPKANADGKKRTDEGSSKGIWKKNIQGQVRSGCKGEKWNRCGAGAALGAQTAPREALSSYANPAL